MFRRLGQAGIWWRSKSTAAILLVADNPALVDVVRRYLDGVRATLLVAPTERDALRQLRARRPSVILLDLELGGPDEHLAQLRALRATGVAPIIALSSSPSKPLRRQVEDAGGTLVLDKLRLGEELAPALVEHVGT